MKNGIGRSRFSCKCRPRLPEFPAGDAQRGNWSIYRETSREKHLQESNTIEQPNKYNGTSTRQQEHRPFDLQCEPPWTSGHTLSGLFKLQWDWSFAKVTISKTISAPRTALQTASQIERSSADARRIPVERDEDQSERIFVEDASGRRRSLIMWSGHYEAAL